MAHNLDITNGIASFASARENAWHRLGNVLPDAMTAEQALDAANLSNWDVRKLPLFTADEQGVQIEVPDRYAVVRNNPVVPGRVDALGVVGDYYHPIQNEDHAAFLNALVDESGAHFETAGALEGGRKVFISMKLPGYMEIGGCDPVDTYLAAVNSHDGSLSFTTMATPVRIVCANTLGMAYQNHSHIVRLRHTSGAKNAVQRARETLELTFSYLDAFQAEAEQLINTTMTQSRFEQIISENFGAKDGASAGIVTKAERKLDEMASLFADAQTQAGIRDTAWAGFNALTEWADHFAPVRGGDEDAARATNAVFYPEFKQRALALMLAG